MCVWGGGGSVGIASELNVEISILFVTSLYSLVGLAWDMLFAPNI